MVTVLKICFPGVGGGGPGPRGQPGPKQGPGLPPLWALNPATLLLNRDQPQGCSKVGGAGGLEKGWELLAEGLGSKPQTAPGKLRQGKLTIQPLPVPAVSPEAAQRLGRGSHRLGLGTPRAGPEGSGPPRGGVGLGRNLPSRPWAHPTMQGSQVGLFLGPQGHPPPTPQEAFTTSLLNYATLISRKLPLQTRPCSENDPFPLQKSSV